MIEKRRFSPEQKMQMIREAEEIGPAAVCRKYEITHSLFYRWKNQFNTNGIEGLQGNRFKADPAIKELELENERLKKIVAPQALELEVKYLIINKYKDKAPVSVSLNKLVSISGT